MPLNVIPYILGDYIVMEVLWAFLNSKKVRYFIKQALMK
jgi:hypothetical protein